MIKATITHNDGQSIIRLFNNLEDFTAWCKRHHGHYIGFTAKTILPGEMRQGKETYVES